MKIEKSSLNDEIKITTLLYDWADATRIDEKDKVLLNHAKDVLIFDVLAPLQYKSADEYKKSWAEWQPASKEDAVFEIHELNVKAGETIAYAHGLIKCGGNPKIDWVRATFCLIKSDDRWMINHQHISMPVAR